MNTAADFLSRLDLDPNDKVQLLKRDDIQTSPIEVYIQSSNVDEEEQLYFLPDDEQRQKNKFGQENREQEKNARNDTTTTPREDPKTNEPNTETDTIISQTEVIRRNCDDEEKHNRTLPRDMRRQQDQDKHQDQHQDQDQYQDQVHVLRNHKLRLLKEAFDEQLMATNRRAFQYITQESHVILKDGLLYQQYFGETKEDKYLRVLLPEHLVNAFLESHHGMNNKHPGTTKVIQQCREKYHFPGLASRIAEHIIQCKKCLQIKRTEHHFFTPPMINTSKPAMGPEEALQLDIVPFDEPSNRYTAIVTARDVFSRYLFTYCVSRIDAKTIARVLIEIMTRYAYLPTTIITDKGTKFMSEMIGDTSRFLGIQMRHGTTKHAQTTDILKRCYASLKEAPKKSIGERRTMWHQFEPIATLNYNTT